MLLKSLRPLTFNYPRNWLVGTKLGWILGCIDNLSLDPKKKKGANSVQILYFLLVVKSLVMLEYFDA